MGYNSDNSARLVFDIETAPLGDAASYMEPAEPPANYKDPIKIQAYIAEKNAENLDRCGLDVDLCRVVAIGYQVEGDDPQSLLVGIDCPTEADLLRAFWLRVADRHLVGFNCLAFDLPVLLRRSQYLGVPTPSIQIDRFKHPTVTDLATVLSFNGAIRMRSLSFYAKRFGISCDPDQLTGVDIAQAVKDGDWAGIEGHVKADVQKTAALASKLGLFHLEPVGVL